MLLTIPGVQILDKIAEGGFSIIYRGKHLSRNETVAVKVLRPEKAKQDPGSVKSFRNEGKLLKELQHEGLIRVFEAATSPVDYIVMELFAGDNLRHAMAKISSSVRRRWLNIALSVGGTLHYLHSKNVIHKDIKPENILISPEYKTKLIDLSIAETKGGFRFPFSSSRIQGSFSCMSPEQIQGKSLDFRSDIYSFGCVLFELITGQPIFPGKTPDEVMRQHLREQPRPVRSLLPTAPPEIDAALGRMLAKNVPDRIEDMNLVLFELRKLHRLGWTPTQGGTRRQKSTLIKLRDATVTYEEVYEDDPFKFTMQNRCTLANITRRTVEFRGRQCLNVGQFLDMLLFFPSTSKPIKARGKIRSVERVTSENYYRTIAALTMVGREYTE
ncbi:MAG: serine/threonine-protein kinase, partial [Planctomycetota bacterium]|nr:serine/threonine-protein kinase [Planctomycetota bacterium]